MAWTIRFDPRAQRDLARLDRPVRQRIIEYLEKRVAYSPSPETMGKHLTGDKASLYRYRIQDYRVICRIQKEQLTVLVLAAGHRKNIYD